ncbi:hypothetical protein M758_7G141500 [Ceratodon purpureus]|uniref:non-specific serine/threonine protein kinase n=1 Tax=Ceratodon purpureus TaxID=3225 RepID=A0A8T0H9X6_CERPU|nr:hypothetical protein KC19_7G136800 [Ceratodon purpureus]KAG0567467.1 hypothetical protein KC19_7G136800 [Ceratodon purpureus]KAG0611443.1 hypothetical protein M758_7G141500 [Ceratodon purpureus]KAG0611444.1 hypothetical protein M758_7G141500 [Ceratodon purpureus]
MGCTWSGLDALVGAVGSGAEVWVNKRRFRIQRQLGEGGFAFVYLVREQLTEQQQWKDAKDPSHSSEDGMYALKKVLIQSDEQLELVNKEIEVSSLFDHPNLIRLLEHSIITVNSPEATWGQEAYLLFPVYRDGTVLDHLTRMQEAKTYFPTITVLHIFQQICAGLKHMHSHDPPYAHNDLKPGNVLLTLPKNQPPVAVIMDFGSAGPARRELQNRKEAMAVQEWAAQHCTAPYRAPELWDPPSESSLDERTDIWALGCTLYALMYGLSPFEYTLAEQGGSLHLAALSGVVKWPAGPNPPYPETLHRFVRWMLNPSVASRPFIQDVCIHVDKLISKFDTDARDLWPAQS